MQSLLSGASDGDLRGGELPRIMQAGIARPTRALLERIASTGTLARELHDHVRLELERPGLSLVEQACIT